MNLPDGLLTPPFAHRGLWSAGDAVENSLAAFEKACRMGYGVELDVRLSSDGEAMVFHDETLKRLAGLDTAVAEMMLISGQKPVKTVAKKAIAGFKIRKGLPIGCKVTLRSARMYEFLDRLVTIALPRVRDFRGVTGKGFDGRGNFAMGVKEQIIFPEIIYDKVDAIRGMDIVFVTTAKTDAEAKALLKGFYIPFAN